MDANTATALGYLFAAIPPTLMAYAALRQGRANGAHVTAQGAKTDAVLAGTRVIHELVNSKMAAALATIASLQALVTKQGAMIEQLEADLGHRRVTDT